MRKVSWPAKARAAALKCLPWAKAPDSMLKAILPAITAWEALPLLLQEWTVHRAWAYGWVLLRQGSSLAFLL
jgi:hypothetical protein